MKNLGLNIIKTDTQKSIFIDKSVVIDSGVKIMPNVYLIGDTHICSGTIIYPNTVIENSFIGKNCIIKSSYIENSSIGENVSVGPFAHIRPNSKIYNNCKIGNFVEIKTSSVGEGTKVSHLAYVGDCDVGKNCNIGCGAIFVNFNGKSKSRTIVGDNCFIGSNCNIVAPVVVADGTYVCAGSTLTIDTKTDDFVIARCRETIKGKRAHNYLNKQN